MINEKYQAKGFGKRVLELAIEWMNKGNRCREIITTYITGNETSENLYTKLEFQQMSEMEAGEIDMILHF